MLSCVLPWWLTLSWKGPRSGHFNGLSSDRGPAPWAGGPIGFRCMWSSYLYTRVSLFHRLCNTTGHDTVVELGPRLSFGGLQSGATQIRSFGEAQGLCAAGQGLPPEGEDPQGTAHGDRKQSPVQLNYTPSLPPSLKNAPHQHSHVASGVWLPKSSLVDMNSSLWLQPRSTFTDWPRCISLLSHTSPLLNLLLSPLSTTLGFPLLSNSPPSSPSPL